MVVTVTLHKVVKVRYGGVTVRYGDTPRYGGVTVTLHKTILLYR